MAITLNTTISSQAGVRFCVNGYSADAQGNEELVAAPTGGKSIYLRRLRIFCIAAITVTINEGTDAIFGPFAFAATAGSPIDLVFGEEVKLTAETALNVDASGAGAVCVVVEGATR